MKAVYIKELRSYFQGSVAYACFTLMFIIAGLYTWVLNILGASGSFEITISGMSLWICLLPVPMLTMRIISEERKQKTDQLLYSLPLKATDIVFGKFFAAITVMLVPVTVFALYPLVLSAFGNVNFASAYSTLFAFYLASCTLIAVGIFISSLTENQIVAAIGTAVAVFANYYMPYIAQYASENAVAAVIFLLVTGILIGLAVFLMTKNFTVGAISAVVLDFIFILLYYIFPDLFEGMLPSLLNNISVFAYIDIFAGGIFNLSGIVFFISGMAVFLFLTVQSLEKRRWS